MPPPFRCSPTFDLVGWQAEMAPTLNAAPRAREVTMATRIRALSLLVALVAVPAPARAAQITFTFTGAFTFSDTPGIVVGDLFSGSFTYDTAAADTLPADPDLGRYDLVAATLTTPFGTTSVGPTSDAVYVDLDTGNQDHQLAVIYNGAFGAQGFNFDLRLTDTDGTIFPDDGLPMILSLAGFESAILDIDFFADVETHGTGPLRTLVQEPSAAVPEPGTVVLLLSGLAWAASRRVASLRRPRA
jgi:hypothetical protein